MARRPTGSLLIALFAALQLVLQPLAAASMCSGAGMDGGGDCCCSSKAEPAAGHGGGRKGGVLTDHAHVLGMSCA